MGIMLHRKVSRPQRSPAGSAGWLRQRKSKREEAVEIQEKRFGYFPKAFRWRGKRYNVQVVERCWTVVKRAPRLCFRVRCQVADPAAPSGEGIFDLYQDLHANTWHLIPLRVEEEHEAESACVR